jgi:AcrR family transcriptional regulator
VTSTLDAGHSPSKGEQTRSTILDAAIERFGRDGLRGTSVADVARDAGVSGSLVYAYFPNKEALFLAALDEDAARVINQGVSHVLDTPDATQWGESLILTLITAISDHPLARRLLAGLEPDVTERVVDIEPVRELRAAVAERLRQDQLAGLVRSDIDPVAIGGGVVAIVLSTLMSTVQFGPAAIATHGANVWAVLTAAIEPVPPT